MSEEGAATDLDLTEATRHLNEAFDRCDVAAVSRAIREIAGLFNVADLARKAGVERTSLYRTFRGRQSPNIATLLALLCQIASKCDPLFASKNDPFDGAETGGAEPHIAEQSRSWRAASREREVMLGS
jgi:probable addiction module antidote protein